MNINAPIQLFLNLAKTQAIMTRRFDSGLDGISLNEFIILIHLSQAEDSKMRRVDLAEKVGLTASGITRLLLPMEKIGLTKKEIDPTDARASFVVLASGGKRKLGEAMERAELITETIIEKAKIGNVTEIIQALDKIANSI